MQPSFPKGGPLLWQSPRGRNSSPDRAVQPGSCRRVRARGSSDPADFTVRPFSVLGSFLCPALGMLIGGWKPGLLAPPFPWDGGHTPWFPQGSLLEVASDGAECGRRTSLELSAGIWRGGHVYVQRGQERLWPGQGKSWLRKASRFWPRLQMCGSEPV